MKVCTKCKKEKPLEAFRRQGSTKDGLKYYCKSCDDETAKKYYDKNKKKIKPMILDLLEEPGIKIQFVVLS